MPARTANSFAFNAWSRRLFSSTSLYLMPRSCLSLLIRVAPMCVDRVGNLVLPRTILPPFQDFLGVKKLPGVSGGFAKWLEQLRANKARNVVLRAVQHPRNFLRRDSQRQVAQHGKKLSSLFVHHHRPCGGGFATQPLLLVQSQRTRNREQHFLKRWRADWNRVEWGQ